MDIEIAGTGFRAQWNLTRDGSLWMIAPNSVQEVGCIHTCQGLEVDYIGVIVGPDFVVRDGRVRTDALERSSMDRSVRGIRKLLRADPERATATADRIIRNTYRTLMSRGRKGCYVYCTDAETRAWFRSLLEAEPAAVAPGSYVAPPGLASLPLRSAPDRKGLAAERAVEVIDLAIAAGTFGAETSPAILGWVEVPAGLPASPDYFVARVRGDSMNKRIPNGAWCLFRRGPAGSLDGRILVVAHHSILDSETGAHYTIKRYRRARTVSAEGIGGTTSIRLEPETWADGYSAIDLRAEDAERLVVVAEFVAILDGA